MRSPIHRARSEEGEALAALLQGGNHLAAVLALVRDELFPGTHIAQAIEGELADFEKLRRRYARATQARAVAREAASANRKTATSTLSR
jgi:hypothetical protein